MDFLLNGLDGSQPMYAPFAYQPLQASNTINSSPSLRDPVLATPLGPIGMTWGPMPLLGSVPGPGALQVPCFLLGRLILHHSFLYNGICECWQVCIQ